MSVNRSCFLSAISDWHLIFFPHCKRKMPSLSHILTKISSSVKCRKREKIIKSLLVLSFFAVFYMEVEKRLKFFYFSDAFQGEWLLGKCNRQLGINGTSYPPPHYLSLLIFSFSLLSFLTFYPPSFFSYLWIKKRHNSELPPEG